MQERKRKEIQEQPDERQKPNAKVKPLRYSSRRFEKARKAIVKIVPVVPAEDPKKLTLDEISKEEVERLSQYLNAALQVYTTNNKHKKPNPRQETIDQINQLIQTAILQKWRKLQLLAKIQGLFHGGNYNYGPFGNSELADLIKIAIDMWRTEKREFEKQNQKEKGGYDLGPATIYINGVLDVSEEKSKKNEHNPTKAVVNKPVYATSLKDMICFGIQQFKDLYIAESGKSEKDIKHFDDRIQPDLNEFITDMENQSDKGLRDLINKCVIPGLREHLTKTVKFFDSLNPDKTNLNDFEEFITREQSEHDKNNKGNPYFSKDNFEILKNFLRLIKGNKLKVNIENLLIFVINIINEEQIKHKTDQQQMELPLPKWIAPACYFLRKHAAEYPGVKDILQNVTGKSEFMTAYNRILNVKTWTPEDKQEDTKEEGILLAKPKKKVMLAIHGLNDSSATWEAQACDWAREGYTVISYDHAGHGQDINRDLRQKNPPLNLQLIQLDLLRQLKELQDDEEIGEIHIAAHSMGGALVAQSLKTISDYFKNVKSITLYAPAAFENPVRSILRAAPYFSKGDREELVEKERKAGNSGLGGPGVGLSTAGEFMKLNERAYNSLEAVAMGTVRLRDDLSIRIIAGEDDKLSRKGNFESLEKIRVGLNNLKIRILKKVGHSLHEPGSPSQELTGDMALHNATLSTDEATLEKRKKLVEDLDKIKEIIIPSDNSVESPSKYIEAYAKLLIPKLQKIYEKGNEVFQEYIVREFQLGNIHFETLIKLNRLTIDPNAEHLNCDAFTQLLGPKKNNKFSATTTASHFKELNAIAKKSDNPGQANKIYKSEIAMLLKLRDERNHYTFFRGGELKTNSYAFFTGTKKLKEDAKLNQKDEVIVALKNAPYKIAP